MEIVVGVEGVKLVGEFATPLPVRDVDRRASQPVQFRGNLIIHDGNMANGVTDFFEVPDKKRLVIEYVSARAKDIAVDDSLDLKVSTTVEGVLVEHYLGLMGPQGRDEQFMSLPVRFYADPGTHVSVGGARLTRQNDAFVVLAMSGHFVDVA